MAAPDCKMVLVALLLSGVPIFLLAPATAEAVADHAMVFAVKLEVSELSARISDREPGTVQFHGSVTVDKLPVCRARVELRAYLDIGWKLDIAPSMIVFTSTTPQHFTVNILVPQGTPADICGNLAVVGRCSLSGQESLAGTRGRITVAPYFGARLETEEPIIISSLGDSASHGVRVQNTGNANGSYELGIANLRDLREYKWHFSCGCTTAMDMGPARFWTIRMHERFEADALSESGSLWFVRSTVISRNGNASEGLILAELSIALYVKPGPAAYLCPSFIILILGVEMALTVKLARDWNRHRLRKAAMEKVDDYGK